MRKFGRRTGRIDTLKHIFMCAMVATLIGVAAGAPAGAPGQEFRPGAVWPDTAGAHINAHGAGFLFDRGDYYWFGEYRSQPADPLNGGVSCYSSKDLYHWKNNGVVLVPIQSSSNGPGIGTPGQIIERPKVIYNAKTARYVMWFHSERRGQGYVAAETGVAVSEKATGPYRFLGSFRPDNEMSRDMTLFQDDDRKAYLFTASEDNRTMHVHLLSDDYTKPSGKWQRIFEARYMEAPAVFKHDGKYYFVGSDCTGWKPNPQRSAVANSVWGPWRELGNPARGPNANLTFLAQTAYVLPVAGGKGAFIWIGDRWRPENQRDSRYVWLPIQFAKERFTIEWQDRWSLDVIDRFRRRDSDPPSQDWAPPGSEDDYTGRGDLPAALTRGLTDEQISALKTSMRHGVTAPGLRLSDADMQWWRDAKFGMFIHWGLYAIPGEGEWVLYNKYLKNGLAPDEYIQLAQQFKGADFNAERIAQLAKDAGMKYMVMVARHHDGYALWNSPATESGFNSVRTAPHRDFVKEYVEAARRAGMRVGLYYSPMDWRFPGYFKPRELVKNSLLLKAQGYGQVRELMSMYGPIDILWYDGGWLAHSGGDAAAAWFWEPIELNRIVRELQPKAVISPRSGWEGDFVCEEGEAEIKGPIREMLWEKALRVNPLGWGYNRSEKLLTLQEIATHLINAVSRNGNMLLNVGPDPDGVVPATQVLRIKEVGAWLASYGESIYGSRPGPFQPVDGVFGSVFRNRTVYLHVLSWPKDILRLPVISKRILASRVLTGGNVTVAVTDKGIELSVPAADRNAIDTIIALDLDGPASEISYR